MTRFSWALPVLAGSSFLLGMVVPQQPPSFKEIAGEPETKAAIVLKNATAEEALVLQALQARGIQSTNALATVLGNIKQESRFISNICEGGARIEYDRCHRGGYGLIQWTTQKRYDGLGRHASDLQRSPSSMEAQVSYMFRETQWKKIEPTLKVSGKSIETYMKSAYRWLGWGIHGKRTQYAYDYAQRMHTVEVPVEKHFSAKFTADHHFLK